MLVFLLDLFFVLSPDAFQHRASTDVITAVLGCYVCAAVAALVLAAARCNHPERFRYPRATPRPCTLCQLMRGIVCAMNFWLLPPLLTLLLNTRRNALQRAALAAGGDMYDVSGLSKLDDKERQQRWMAAASLQELLKQADAQTHYDEE